MALSQSALSELLDAIRAGGSADVMRDAMVLVLQEIARRLAGVRIARSCRAATSAARSC